MRATDCRRATQSPQCSPVASGPLLRWLMVWAWLSAAAACAGCGKPQLPPPDGSSGVRGVALAPAEPPGEDGKTPARQPWTGLRVGAMLANSPDADYKTEVRTLVDAQGRFEFALNPGQYLINVFDPERLTGKMSSPMLIKVEPGKFTEIIVDYDKLGLVQKVPLLGNTRMGDVAACTAASPGHACVWVFSCV